MVSGPLEMELWVAVSHLTWVLGAELGSPTRAVYTEPSLLIFNFTQILIMANCLTNPSNSSSNPECLGGWASIALTGGGTSRYKVLARRLVLTRELDYFDTSLTRAAWPMPTVLCSLVPFLVQPGASLCQDHPIFY